MKKTPQALLLFLALFIFSGTLTANADPNTAPVLDTTKSPAFPSFDKDAGVPSGAVGWLVSNFVDFATPTGQVDNVTDPDSDALLGIAITATDTSDLTWYYSINNGTSWAALGAVSSSSSRLLAADSNNRLYARSTSTNAATFSSALTFRAWDRTTGTDGGLASTSTNGGTAAFSTLTDTISLSMVDSPAAPDATNLSAPESYTEDTTKALTDIVISDADSSIVAATLVVSDTDYGSLSTGTSNSVTSSYDSTSGIWNAVGALSDVNVLLAAVSFVPAQDESSSLSISTIISDGSSILSGSKALTGTPVNDGTAGTNLSAPETYTEDTPLDLVDIVISDVDDTDVSFFTFIMSDPDAGSLSTGTSGAVTSTYDTGSGEWVASGAITDINILLADVTFTPALDYNSDFSIQTAVSDGHTSATVGTKIVTGVAVADAVPDNDSPSRSSGSRRVPPHTPTPTGVGPATSPTAPPPQITHAFTHNLFSGMSDSEVKLLQEYLNARKIFVASAGPGSPGNETSYFGPLTKAALVKFQLSQNISPAVGFFGPITRGVINSDNMEY